MNVREKLIVQLEREGRPEELFLGQLNPMERNVLVASEEVGPSASLLVPSSCPNMYARNHSWDPFRVYRLKNVTLDSSSGYVFHEGHVIAQSRGSVRSASDGSFVSNSWMRVKTRASVKVLDHPIVGPGYLSNYYHWLIEVLPRVIWAHKVQPNVVAMIPSDSPAFVVESLKALGIPMKSTRNEVLVAPEIVLADPTPRHFPYPGSIQLLVDQARESVQLVPIESKMVFIERRAASRSFQGDDELRRWLEGIGIEPVDLATLTWVDQVALFRDASLIIGAHGAGLANSVFSHPRTPVVEITSGSWWSIDYATLSAIQGRPYSLCLVNQDQTAPHGRASDVIRGLGELLTPMIAGQEL